MSEIREINVEEMNNSRYGNVYNMELSELEKSSRLVMGLLQNCLNMP